MNCSAASLRTLEEGEAISYGRIPFVPLVGHLTIFHTFVFTMNPLVSIIIPIYKVEKYIARCAKSAFNQTYDNIEFIFVNDCTPDSSVEILEKTIAEYPSLQPRITILHHQVNRGLAAARNTGFDKATGKYTIHIDSDDYAEPTFIEDLLNKAEETGADMVICDFYRECDSDNYCVHIRNNDSSHDSKKITELLIKSQIAPFITNKLIRRDLLIKNNIRAVEGIDIGEDKVVSFRAAYLSKKIAFVPKPLYHYIYNSNSLTNQSGKNDKWQKCSIGFIKLMEEFAAEHNFDNNLLNAIKEYKCYQLCKTALRGNICYYKSTCSIYDDISVEDIKSSSMCVFNYKIGGIALRKSLYLTVSLLRALYRLKRGLTIHRKNYHYESISFNNSPSI